VFHRLRTPLVSCCVGLVLAGCSANVTVTEEESISKPTLERDISDTLTEQVGQRPDAVECPGPVKARAGESIRCVLSAENVRYGLTATIDSYTDGRARYTVQVDEQPQRG